MEKLTGKDKHTVKVESRSTYKYDIKTNNCKKRTVQKEDIENAFEIERQQHKTILYIYIQTAASKPHRNCKLKIHTPKKKSTPDIYTRKRKKNPNAKDSHQITRKKNKRGRKKTTKRNPKQNGKTYISIITLNINGSNT